CANERRFGCKRNIFPADINRKMKLISACVAAMLLALILRPDLIGQAGPPAPAQTPPRIFFSDLDSGPNTGGQKNHGAWVTIWGKGFGAERGASTVTIGGGAAAE